jgi:hypothetical protein
MFSNKLIWNKWIWSFIFVCFLLIIFGTYLGWFKFSSLFVSKESMVSREEAARDEFGRLNLVYNSNGGFPSDGRGPEVYVNNDVKNRWSERVVKEFLRVQATQNPDVIFDMDMIQFQATQREAEELINTGMWPWSQRTQDIYTDAISRLSFSKKGPLKSMNNDRTIYNEHAILKMIALNDKEGQFLIQGARVESSSDADQYSGRGTYGVDSGLISDDNDLIQCNRGQLERVHKVGNDGINGAQVNQLSRVDFRQLPNLVKGFTFIKQPCDPCVALNMPANYTCPFSLEKSDQTQNSFAWETLWGLPASPIPELPLGFPYWLN